MTSPKQQNAETNEETAPTPESTRKETATHSPPRHPTTSNGTTSPRSSSPNGNWLNYAALPPTLHRWINEGFITGEQLTPGAPWRIRLTDEIRALFIDDAPDGWLAMLEATLAHGLSRSA